jgi:hypothetical protein
MKRIFRQTMKCFSFEEGPRVPIPSLSKSSGDKNLDEATKKWRATNTVDDEKIKILFEKQKGSGLSFDNFMDQIDKNVIVKKEMKVHINEETGL